MTSELYQQMFDQNEARYLEEWKAFLRFKSISTDPAYSADCVECARWVSAQLEGMGIKSRLLETPGKPVVFGEYAGKAGSPTVIFYGHYDVQPVDPLEAWQTPPFSPELRDGRMYARGAQDNKGQVFYVLKAIEALIARKELNCSIKFFIEGEEECSSTGFSKALPSWKEFLRGDILMVCDTGMIQAGKPAITMGLRGIVYLTVKITGPRHDLHSGIHGGVSPNPAIAMARLISTLHHEDGSIAVDGYYEGMEEPSAEDLKLARLDDIPADRYEKEVGLAPVGGERGRPVFDRRGFRPTVEVNGIHSGYGGEGSKTIIPALATAKLSSRLVLGQDPARCLELLKSHLRKHAPAGLILEICEAGIGGPDVRLRADSPLVSRARAVLGELSRGAGVSYIWEGGSIPVVALLAKLSGAEPLLVGFGLDEDNVHAPNESFAVSRLRDGFLYACMFLKLL